MVELKSTEKEKMLISSTFVFFPICLQQSFLPFRRQQDFRFGQIFGVYRQKFNVADLGNFALTHSHTMTPFDAHGKQAF